MQQIKEYGLFVDTQVVIPHSLRLYMPIGAKILSVGCLPDGRVVLWVKENPNNNTYPQMIWIREAVGAPQYHGTYIGTVITAYGAYHVSEGEL